MRTIAVVTSARSDYGIFLPVLRKISTSPMLKLKLIVTGMHLSPEFGFTVRIIEKDGFMIEDRIETIISSDSPAGIAKAMGLGITGFAQLFSRFRPDILMVTGDRYDMYCAVLAALPFNIPVAHIHGGESTEGVIDEALRHSTTKLSHIHFVSTPEYGRRVIQMGEDPSRVHIVGAPALDNLCSIDYFSRTELEAKLGINLEKKHLLVTFHPVTLEYEEVGNQTEQLLTALEALRYPAVFTLPNADTANRIIIHKIRDYVKQQYGSVIYENMGCQMYYSMMKNVAAMVGNSSSGIIEAASFMLPVVNIGNRQRGRIHGKNVIDVPHETSAIMKGIKTACSDSFRKSIEGIKNPYGDGSASEKIVEVLNNTPLDHDIIRKKFYAPIAINKEESIISNAKINGQN